MTRRVILGNLGSGVYGLRVSLPGKDVINDAGDDANLSFDSGWTDLAKLIQIGTATKTADFSLTDIPFTYPGYTPLLTFGCAMVIASMTIIRRSTTSTRTTPSSRASARVSSATACSLSRRRRAAQSPTMSFMPCSAFR